MVLNIHRNHKAHKGGGESSTEVGEERYDIYLLLYCHHQNDSCIKMGSHESHFNVSLIVKYKVTWQCPQTTTFSKGKKSQSGISSWDMAVRQLVTVVENHGANTSINKLCSQHSENCIQHTWKKAF